jgi:glutamate N-acetyltransferase / amino-acid N-acetyltransferase
MKSVKGGVCAAQGFRAGGVHAGLKRVLSTKKDLAVVLSDVPCVAGGCFTTNRVKAAPVLMSQEHLAAVRSHRGVVLNSGNANACTGEVGLADARETARLAAQHFGDRAENWLICSTGRIGVPMKMAALSRGMSRLPAEVSRKGHREAAIAIMTSDTFPKEVALEVTAPAGVFRLGGMAKGAGMINPNMATMLCLLTTDVQIAPGLLRKILAEVVEVTFNRITVDGDMSTNDTVLLLANGVSGVKIESATSAEGQVFSEGLRRVSRDLARMIVRDGEGTTKVVEIEVVGAQTDRQAKKAAEAVANSVLFKCALAGEDPNWGRILDALGYSGAEFDPAKVDIFYGAHHLVKSGQVGPASIARVKALARGPEFRIRIDLAAGEGTYLALTTDLTEEYVRLNLSE